MAKYYVNDTTLIRLNCGTDVSSALTKRILYWKPNGASGYWDASLFGTDYLEYQIPSVTVLDVIGTWKFSTFIILSGGAQYTGETASQMIFKRGR